MDLPESQKDQFQNSPPETTQPQRPLDGLPLGAVVLILVLVAGAALWFWYDHQRSVLLTSVEVTEEIPEPSGTILLDLAPLGEQNYFQHHYDTKTGDLERVRGLGYSASDARDGRSLVAIDNDGDARSVFVFDSKTDAHEPFTSGDTAIKMLPALSPDGTHVAYMVYPNDIKDVHNTQAWSIFIAEKGNDPERIALGTDPHWSPDGKHLLFVGEDGLRLFDVEEQVIINAWELADGQSYVGMKIDVSNDGEKLAWSNTENSEIVVARIVSWDPFIAKVQERIPTDAFWPTFSPDGDWLAYQEVEWGTPNQSPRLMLYHIPTGESMFATDLAEYDQERMFITDWVQI